MNRWRTGDEIGRIHPTAVIYEGVDLGHDVTVFPGAVIGRPPMGVGMIPPKSAGAVTRIGAGSVIGANAVIYQGVVTGPECLIADGVVIREDVVLGTRAVIGQNATIQNGARIGDRSRVLDLSHVTAGAIVGDDVFWSVNVISLNDNSMNHGGELEYPSVGDGASLGAGAVILPGQHVGERAIVGAGAVVTHDVADDGQVRGIPARPLDFFDLFGGYDGRFEKAKATLDATIKDQHA